MRIVSFKIQMMLNIDILHHTNFDLKANDMPENNKDYCCTINELFHVLTAGKLYLTKTN